jgi:hypothetical protein
MLKTKTTILFITVFLLTWLFLSLIGWILSTPEVTLKDCAIFPATPLLMLLFGWIPAGIISDEYYQKNTLINHLKHKNEEIKDYLWL